MEGKFLRRIDGSQKKKTKTKHTKFGLTENNRND